MKWKEVILNGKVVSKLVLNGKIIYQKIKEGVIEWIKPSSYNLNTYLADLQDAKTRILNNRKKMGSDRVEFIFITDIHWGTRKTNGDSSIGNAKVSPYMIQWIKDNVSGLSDAPVLFGGDIIYDENATKEGAIAEVKDAMTQFGSMFCTLGNHDNNDADKGIANSDWMTRSKVLSYSEIYDLMLKQNLSFNNAHNVKDFEESNYCHKVEGDFFDDDVHKVRYVQFNMNNHNGKKSDGSSVAIGQGRAALQTFLKYLPAGYRVIAMCHGVGTLVNTYHPENSWTNVDKLKLVMCGHKHSIAHEEQTIQGHKIPFATRRQDMAWGRVSKASDFYRTDNNQDFYFEVIQVDFTNKKFYCTGVGCYGSYYDTNYNIYD